MFRFYLFRSCFKKIALVLLLLPACTASPTVTPQNVDSRIPVLQRENRQLVNNQIATQKAVADIYSRMNALDSKLDFLETRIQVLLDRTQPGPSISPSPPLAKYNKQDGSGRPLTSVTKKEVKKVKPKPATATKKSRTIAKKMTTKSLATKRGAQKQYDQAYLAYKNKRYDEALALFKSFIKDHPQHHLADNAQYWIGEIYYDIENFPSAILAFKEVAAKYGDENKAPDALLKIGYAYIALDDPENARLFLKRVIKNYPFSDAEAKAREKLKELQNQ